MQTRKLGNSGLEVSTIGLGCMSMSGVYGEADDDESIAVIQHAIGSGVTFIDTADAYGHGHNEQVAGKALKGRREQVVLATKFGNTPDGTNGRPEYVQQACEASLQRLGMDVIDLYYQHRVDPNVPIEETVGAMSRLVEQGKVRAVGCSNQSGYGLVKSLWMADREGSVRYETIQNNFSLLNRRFEDELSEVCRREQVSLLPYSPIAGGVLSGKYQGGAFPEAARFTLYAADPARGAAMTRRFINDRSLAACERFGKIAAECGLALPTLATAWTLAQDFVGSTLIGATSVAQLDPTLAAAGVDLPEDVLRACDEVSREILYPMG